MSSLTQFLFGMLILLGSIATASIARASFSCTPDEFHTGWSRTSKPFKLVMNKDELALTVTDEKGKSSTLIAKSGDGGDFLVSSNKSSQKVFSTELDSALRTISVCNAFTTDQSRIRVEMDFDQDFGAYSNFYNCRINEKTM